MYKTKVEIEDLRIYCEMKDGDSILLGQGANTIIFPKERCQEILDAILTVDWAIMKRKNSLVAMRKPDEKRSLLKKLEE